MDIIPTVSSRVKCFISREGSKYLILLVTPTTAHGNENPLRIQTLSPNRGEVTHEMSRLSSREGMKRIGARIDNLFCPKTHGVIDRLRVGVGNDETRGFLGRGRAVCKTYVSFPCNSGPKTAFLTHHENWCVRT